MKRVAVIDSSPLIYLSHLGLAVKLSLYFDRIYVPRRVQVEVNKKQRFRYRLNKLYETGLFVRCQSADETRVQLLRIDRLGNGEAEGLVQAQEKEARFFIADETKARAVSEKQGLVPVGTLWLIARLSLEGHAADTHSLVRKLKRDLDARMSDTVVEKAIASAPLPI
jgi:predicted nucleic acid-binding protein